MPLARLSLLKSAALLGDSGSTNDSAYKLLLKQATALINRECARQLETTDYEDIRYLGDGRTRLYLAEWPCLDDIDLLLVEIWDGSAWVTIDATHYELRENRYVEYPALGKESVAAYGCWPSSSRENIQLTYAAGYETANWDTAAITASFAVPEDLEQACAMLAAHLWKQKGRAGISAQSFGPRSIQYRDDAEEIPEEVRCMIEPYKRIDL